MKLSLIPIFLLLLMAATPSFSADGEVTADTAEWQSFDYQQAGLTQWEYQQIREKGLSKDKLMHLLELGIRPAEYFQKPWEQLGVTETEWIDQRSRGMEDGDIDRSYRNHSGDQDLAYWSLLVPGLYQWKHGNVTTAITMESIWALSAAGFIWLLIDTPTNDETYFLAPLLLVHAWSFGDAFWNTRWDNNPDANRFSWGVGPTLHGGVAGIVQIPF